jgi:type I restriction enzyme S subunit
MDGSLVGRSFAILSDNDVPALLLQRVARIRSSSIDQKYLKAWICSQRFTEHCDAMKTVTAIPHISPVDIRSFTIAHPTTKAEQEAIAEALSDADALIESMEQLIAKKRRIKQGAMQELLTGKKRLPGFIGKWKVKRLGDVAPLQRGFDLPNPQLKPGPYPVVYSNGILNHHIAFQVKGPGVVTGRSGTIGTVTFVLHDFWPHNTSLWVTSFKGNDPKYIYYLYTRIGLERFATGSGVPTLNRNDVHEFKIAIPPTIAEQTAIAAILSDMDAEIAALEEKLAKAQQIKQGMMQELLTGRIRLV